MSDGNTDSDGMDSRDDQGPNSPNDTGSAELQSLRAGKGGIVPPVEHRWKPGQSGNPEGRKTLGATVREELNSFACDKDLNEQKLRRIARDPGEHPNRRTAAVQFLRSFEAPDMADFAGLLRGQDNLEDLRKSGFNTEAIKKIKQKTRLVPKSDGDGTVEELVEREIELYDRAGQNFDRVVEHTAGRARQSVEVMGKDGGPIVQEMQPVSPDDAFKNVESLLADMERRERGQIGMG